MVIAILCLLLAAGDFISRAWSHWPSAGRETRVIHNVMYVQWDFAMDHFVHYNMERLPSFRGKNYEEVPYSRKHSQVKTCRKSFSVNFVRMRGSAVHVVDNPRNATFLPICKVFTGIQSAFIRGSTVIRSNS